MCLLALILEFCYRVTYSTTSILHTSHTHPHNRLMALCPVLPGYAGTRRNIHPLTHPDHRISFINFFHLLRSAESSLFNLRAWQSFSTTSLQVPVGLPLGLGPSTSYSIHFFTQSSSFCNTCPHQCSLFCCNTNATHIPDHSHLCSLKCHLTQPMNQNLNFKKYCVFMVWFRKVPNFSTATAGCFTAFECS